MNHEIETIANYVCEYYGVTADMIKSPNRQYELVKARNMLLLLAGQGKDYKVATYLNRDRTTMVNNRKNFLGNMRYNKPLEREFIRLKNGLIQFEIA